MSRKAIQQIRQTEDQAEILCRVAEERAAEMRERVTREGEAHLAAVECDTEAEFAAELQRIRSRAAALEEKKRAEAEKEAAALELAARERLPEAVHRIVWGIIEKCQ